MHIVSRLFLATVAVCCTAASAAAQAPAAQDWRFKIGAGAMLGPDYDGSDDYEFMPIPDIEINYRDSVGLKNTAQS